MKSSLCRPVFPAGIINDKLFIMNIQTNKQGTALLATILLMSVIFFLGIYFLNFTIIERKISEGQTKGVKTYHLAEAGIEEMIWRLKHNGTYKSNFEEDEDWSASFSRTSPFGGNGSYSVSIDNTGLAQGNIEAVGKIADANGNTSQRVVRTTVYKAIASSTRVDGYALFSDNDIYIKLTNVVMPTSSMHANHDIDISGPDTDVNVDNDVEAVSRFSTSSGASINVGGEISDSYEYSPAPSTIKMPPVSFDNPDDPDAFKNRADVIYSEKEFENLLKDASGGSLVLDSDIIYVEGDVELSGDVDITLEGMLVANGNMQIGHSCGKETNLVVNHSSSTPAGLTANGNIEFDSCFDYADIHGIIYATKDVIFTNYHSDMSFEGGAYGRNIEVVSIWEDNTMIFNKDVVHDSLDITKFSPIVTVEHWEEEY